MAASIPTSSAVNPAWNLTDCAICKCILDNPKTLQCLHSFCLKCLEKLLLLENDKAAISCPTCSVFTALTSRGLSALDVICVVNRLREQKIIKEALGNENLTILCTSCDGPDAWDGK